jgi:hypothetical protein
LVPLSRRTFTVEQAAGYAQDAKVVLGEEAALTTPGPYEAWTEAARLAREKAASDQASFLRDLFANPFAPPPAPSQTCLAWGGRTVPKLAAAIYEERAFDRLPILADALEESGCTDAAILAHCRTPAVHVRGCWVVDLLLGKE